MHYKNGREAKNGERCAGVEVLRQIVAEVDAMRNEYEATILRLQNATIRLALHQLQRGPIAIDGTDERWDWILERVKSGDINLGHDGVVVYRNHSRPFCDADVKEALTPPTNEDK